MTGLDPRRDRIVEAAVIVTDKHLKIRHQFESAVFQPPKVLAGMSEWCQTQHKRSGLIERVPTGMTEARLDDQLCALGQSFFKKNPVILAGNSIAHDRKFVEAYLPRFAATLHYRMLDVSSFKIVFADMFGKEFKKRKQHRALDDIQESIAELQYYLGGIDPTRLGSR